MTITAIINDSSSDGNELEPVQVDRITQATAGLGDILADILGE